MQVRWYVCTIDSLLASPLAQEHALLILEHVFYTIISGPCRFADKEDHIEYFRYYLDNGLYYTRSDSEIYKDLNRYEDKATRETLFRWFKECRGIAPSKAMKLNYYIKDREIGVGFEEVYAP